MRSRASFFSKLPSSSHKGLPPYGQPEYVSHVRKRDKVKSFFRRETSRSDTEIHHDSGYGTGSSASTRRYAAPSNVSSTRFDQRTAARWQTGEDCSARVSPDGYATTSSQSVALVDEISYDGSATPSIITQEESSENASSIISSMSQDEETTFRLSGSVNIRHNHLLASSPIESDNDWSPVPSSEDLVSRPGYHVPSHLSLISERSEPESNHNDSHRTPPEVHLAPSDFQSQDDSGPKGWDDSTRGTQSRSLSSLGDSEGDGPILRKMEAEHVLHTIPFLAARRPDPNLGQVHHNYSRPVPHDLPSISKRSVRTMNPSEPDKVASSHRKTDKFTTLSNKVKNFYESTASRSRKIGSFLTSRQKKDGMRLSLSDTKSTAETPSQDEVEEEAWKIAIQVGQSWEPGERYRQSDPRGCFSAMGDDGRRHDGSIAEATRMQSHRPRLINITNSFSDTTGRSVINSDNLGPLEMITNEPFDPFPQGMSSHDDYSISVSSLNEIKVPHARESHNFEQTKREEYERLKAILRGEDDEDEYKVDLTGIGWSL
ncbi:hypothetical protein IAR55_005326 [Kwoniella newhampshirensis]|uniref:Uncharacterized protein n=1 Tax=Kwoniella newhampshirensis TaxID=1651941 RepID=A0AAW0YTK1_9TREE